MLQERLGRRAHRHHDRFARSARNRPRPPSPPRLLRDLPSSPLPPCPSPRARRPPDQPGGDPPLEHPPHRPPPYRPPGASAPYFASHSASVSSRGGSGMNAVSWRAASMPPRRQASSRVRRASLTPATKGQTRRELVSFGFLDAPRMKVAVAPSFVRFVVESSRSTGRRPGVCNARSASPPQPPEDPDRQRDRPE